jgi:hypothetical protein
MGPGDGVVHGLHFAGPGDAQKNSGAVLHRSAVRPNVPSTSTRTQPTLNLGNDQRRAEFKVCCASTLKAEDRSAGALRGDGRYSQ